MYNKTVNLKDGNYSRLNIMIKHYETFNFILKVLIFEYHEIMYLLQPV